MKTFRLVLVTTAALFIFSFSAQTVHANSYSMGGGMTFVGNIDNSTYAPSGSIRVDGYIESSNPYSGGIPAYLTATTNGTTKTIVPQQTVPAYGDTGSYSQYFDAPSVAGSYSVAFSASADIPPAQQVVGFDLSIYGTGGNCGYSGCANIIMSISLAQALTQTITLYVDDELWDSYVNGPNTNGASITIPAGQTDGSQVVAISASSSSSNTYLSSNGQYTAVNGTDTDTLLGGTLLSVYGNTKLQLNSSNVSYFFSCSSYNNYVTCY